MASLRHAGSTLIGVVSVYQNDGRRTQVPRRCVCPSLPGPLSSGVAFSARWTTQGISYVAEVHEGYLRWGSATDDAPGPIPTERIEPSTFQVVSQTDNRGERTIVASVSGREVTVVIPVAIVAVLERAWSDVNRQ